MHRTKLSVAVALGAFALAGGTASAQSAPEPEPTPPPAPEPVPAPMPPAPEPTTPAQDTPPYTDDQPGDEVPPMAAPVPAPVYEPIETPRERSLLTKWGIGLSLGGGVAGFTDEDTRDAIGTSGVWDVRAVFGTRSPIALEAAYQGSAGEIDAIGLDQDAILLGTALEADVRLNVLAREIVQPYIFVGAAWKRYDLTNVDVNTSAVQDTDDLFEVPMGVGLTYRNWGFVGDLRGEFRAATEEDLIPELQGDESLPMHTWGVTARLGYEF